MLGLTPFYVSFNTSGLTETSCHFLFSYFSLLQQVISGQIRKASILFGHSVTYCLAILTKRENLVLGILYHSSFWKLYTTQSLNRFSFKYHVTCLFIVLTSFVYPKVSSYLELKVQNRMNLLKVRSAYHMPILTF